MSKNSGTTTIEQIERELSPKGELSLHFKPSPFATKLVSWYQANKALHPWRVKFEKTSDPYFVWISEIMLQQTVIAAVTPKYLGFIKKYKNVSSLAAASEKDLQQVVSGLGYYRRFRMMHEAAKQIDSMKSFPSNYKNLLEIKGIGEYTASAISSICFDEPEAVIDGNVERVFCRIFDLRLPPNLPKLKKIFKKTANTVISKNHPGDFNQGIMELGQTICTPTKPACAQCPISKVCKAYKNSSTDLAPAKKLKKSFVDLATNVLIVKDGEKYLLHERSKTSKFLKDIEGFQISVGPSIRSKISSKPLGSFKHTITQHKLTNNVYLVKKNQKNVSTQGTWLNLDDLQNEVTTSFDKKALQILIKHEKSSL
jgi:A/G-specific adenine glycosylase